MIFAISMVNYVQLQSELTAKIKSVANKQIELNNLKSYNDEHLARITGSVDLERLRASLAENLG